VLILDHLKTLHVFTDEEIRLATTLAAQAAVALEKARLYDEIQQRLQQTETLLAVSQAIGSAPDLPEAVRRTTREMVRILGADTGVAWCMTGGGDRFIPSRATTCRVSCASCSRACPSPRTTRCSTS